MESTSKMREDSDENNGIDRLSELPDHILVHILTFLPIVDAVRIVSIRRFGNLWTLLPSLIFDDSLYFNCYSGETDFEKRTHCLVNFVRNVLFLHKKVSIDKFKLCFECNDVDDSVYKSFDKEFTAWIRFAIDRQVNKLCIEGSGDGSILPQCVFTSQFLVELNLVGFRINELSRVKMGSLTKLSLMYGEVSNEAMRKIILGSPSLQELDLFFVRGLNELRFTAPNIQKLDLAVYHGLLDCPNLKTLYFASTTETPMQVVDVSSIREVTIKVHYNQNVEEYAKKFTNAELIDISDRAFQFSKQDFPQTRWKRLHIDSTLFGDNFLGICRVLRCSPHLEELKVYTNSEYNSGITYDNNVLFIELPFCLMQHLRTVTMHGYKVPCPGLLRLAEFLLLSSVTLEKMVILPDRNNSTAVDEFKFVQQLLSFPRASTNARVIFGSDIY